MSNEHRQPAGAHPESAVSPEAPPPTRTVLADGTVEYRAARGRRHRQDGPALEHTDGSYSYSDHGVWRWADGPSSFNAADGSTTWALNGQMRRSGGPAVENALYLEWWDHGVNTRNVDRVTGEDLGGTPEDDERRRLDRHRAITPTLAARARREGYRGTDIQLATEGQACAMRAQGATGYAKHRELSAAALRGVDMNDLVWRAEQNLDLNPRRSRLSRSPGGAAAELTHDPARPAHVRKDHHHGRQP